MNHKGTFFYGSTEKVLTERIFPCPLTSMWLSMSSAIIRKIKKHRTCLPDRQSDVTERIYYVRRRIYHRSKASDPRGDDHLTKYRTRHFQFRYLVFLGAGTSITPESYDTMSIYIGAAGTGTFLIGEQPETMDLHPDEILLVPERTLCGVKTGEGCIYTEIITKRRTL